MSRGLLLDLREHAGTILGLRNQIYLSFLRGCYVNANGRMKDPK